MNENDKTEILEPVETPAENITEPSKDGRKCPKWLLPLVAAVCAVILVAAGIIGWNAYSGAKLAEAKEADLAAHAAQTEVITQALSGAENADAASLLMVHAQDHYMTSQLARDLIEEIIKIFEERDAQAKQA